MKTPLFHALGGAPTIRAVVDGFYERVLGDDALARFFAAVDMTAQRTHMAAFVGVVLGGPAAYPGRSMRDAHRGLQLDDRHFDAVAGHLRATLEAASVGAPDVTTILAAVESLRADVIGASDSTPA